MTVYVKGVVRFNVIKAFFSDDRFLDSLHKSFSNQTFLNLRKEKWTFLNRVFTVCDMVLSSDFVGQQQLDAK